MIAPHTLPPEDPQTQLLQAEWSRRTRRQRVAGWGLIAWTILVTGFVSIALSGLVYIPLKFGLAVFPVYFLPCLFYVLFGMVNFRCPRCSKNLGRVRNPRFCFNCGLHLRP